MFNILMIWNNKQLKLVTDRSKWDKNEFVIARKVRVQFKDDQPISIDFVKNSIEQHCGARTIQKIEIFSDAYTDTHTAHVTFKRSFALQLIMYLHLHPNKNSNIQLVVPVHTDQQPDCPYDSSKSGFYNLPIELVMMILEFCDIHTLVCVALSCKKFSQMLQAAVFPKRFTSSPSLPNRNWELPVVLKAFTESEFNEVVITASRLVRLINPLAFQIVMEKMDRFWRLSLDLASMNKYSKLSLRQRSIDVTFLHLLAPIAKRINYISLRCMAKLSPRSMEHSCMFPNAKIVEVRGDEYSRYLEFTLKPFDFEVLTPSVEVIIYRHLDFIYNIQSLHNVVRANTLKRISFEDCCLHTRITYDSFYNLATLIQMANRCERKTNHFPLSLTFTSDVRYHDPNDLVWADKQTNEAIRQAMANNAISKSVKVSFRIGETVGAFKRQKF